MELTQEQINELNNIFHDPEQEKIESNEGYKLNTHKER